MSDIASETHVQRNKIAAKPGRKPKEVWKFFTPIGQKKDGHQSCKCNYCPWSQTHGEPSSMEAHLALSCHKAPIDIKEKFLLIIKSRGKNQIINLEEEKSILPIKSRTTIRAKHRNSLKI